MAITAAVKGGGADIWGATLSLTRGVTPIAKTIARRLQQKELRADRRTIRTLLGVVAGSTATETYRRVQHVLGNELGGKRVTETQNLINRATTAQDVTDLTARYLTYASQPTYAVDKARRF